MAQPATMVAVVGGEQAKAKFMHDLIGQVVWSARRNDWDGAVPSRSMESLAANIAYVVDNMPRAITRSLFQALFSVVCHAVRLLSRPPQPIKAQPLQACIHATRILYVLNERGLSVDGAPDPTPFPGQAVNDEKVVLECLRGAAHLTGGWLQRSSNTLLQYLVVLFNNFWLTASKLAGATPKTRAKVVKCMQQVMTDDASVALLATPAVITGGFLRSFAQVVRCLGHSDVNNWAEVVVRLTSSFLRIPLAPNLRAATLLEAVQGQALPREYVHAWLGSLDTQRLSAYILLLYQRNTLHVQAVRQFARLLTETTPAPGFLQRLVGSDAHTQLLRSAVVKAVISARGEKASGADAPAAPVRLTTLHTAVLAAAAQAADGFDPPAKQAVVKAVRAFAEDGKVEACGEDLPPEMCAKLERVWYAYVCCGCAPAQWVAGLPAAAKTRVADAVRELFVGTLLADELLFTSPARDAPNMPYVMSGYMKKHHVVFALPRARVADLYGALPFPAKRKVLGDLGGHAQGVGRLLTDVLARSRETRNDQMYVGLEGFLRHSFGMVLAFVKACAPGLKRRDLRERVEEASDAPDRITAGDCEECLGILEQYFGTFKYSALPPLPRAQPQATADGPARRQAMQQYQQRLADRVQFVELSSVLSALLPVLERERRYSDVLVKKIAAAASVDSTRLSGQPEQVQAWWRLVFALFALRLCLPSVESQAAVAQHVPRFLKFCTGRHPQPILHAAHSLIVALIGQQSPEAAKGFGMYVAACVPCDVLEGGALKADVRRLPSVPLLREFTRHIRGVCQNVEEWEGEGGVGLVLYTAEALRTVILTISQDAAGHSSVAKNLRRLYIDALVHLLQCRHTDVLGKVCASLETIFASLNDVREVTYWLGYTSKAIKDSHNPTTKQQVVTWFLTLQSLLSPEKLGGHAFRAKL